MPPVDWRQRLLSPPDDGTKPWHGYVAVLVAMAAYGLLLGGLLSQGVDWWLSALAPLGWALPLTYVTANLLNRRPE